MKKLIIFLLLTFSATIAFSQTPSESIEIYDFLNKRIGKNHKINVVNKKTGVVTEGKFLLEAIVYVGINKVNEKTVEEAGYTIRHYNDTQFQKDKFNGDENHYRIPKLIVLVDKNNGDRYNIHFSTDSVEFIGKTFMVNVEKQGSIKNAFYNIPVETFELYRVK